MSAIVIVAISVVEALAFVLLFLIVLRTRVRPILDELAQALAGARGTLMHAHGIAGTLEATALRHREAATAEAAAIEKLPEVLQRATASTRPPPARSGDVPRVNACDEERESDKTQIAPRPALPVAPTPEEREVYAALRALEEASRVEGFGTFERASRLLASARPAGRTVDDIAESIAQVAKRARENAYRDLTADRLMTLIISRIMGIAADPPDRSARLPGPGAKECTG